MLPKNYIIACKPFGFIRMERKTNKKSLKGLRVFESAARILWHEFVEKARKSQLEEWFGTSDLVIIKSEIEQNIMVLEISDINRLSLFVTDFDKDLIIKESFKNLKTRNKDFSITRSVDTIIK